MVAHINAMPEDRTATEAMPNKQANQEDLWMMSSNHLIDVAEGMASMQYKRNPICIAACFRVEENVGVKNPTKGVGCCVSP